MNTNNLQDKLDSVERVLGIYNNKKKALVKEIKIDLPLDELKSIVPPRDGDELLYMGYILNENQLNIFNDKLGNVINIDLNSYYYVLDCIGIYNW